MVIDRWGEVPHTEKRGLFEAFAHEIHLSKISRHTKEAIVYWRDGSISRRSTTHKSLGYFWEADDLEKLREMVEGDVDQWIILRTFPDYTWRALQGRYAYKYGNRRWRTAYAGKKPYGPYTSWRETEEFKAERANTPQLEMSGASTCGT